MAVCIPSLVVIYRAPLSAASEYFVFLTGFSLIFTPPMQGVVCRHTGLKMRHQVQNLNPEEAYSGAI